MALHTDKTEDKYSRIITAATGVFAEKGYFKATVSDIADAADVAEGTIYLYFKNKEDLLISIFETSIDMFIEEVDRELAGITDPKEGLRRFIYLHLNLVDRHKDLAQVLHVELRQSEKFMKDYRGGKLMEYLDKIGGLIEEGQRGGVFRSELNPKILRRAFFGALDEVSLKWVLAKNRQHDVREWADQLASFFLDGLLMRER